MEPEDKAMFLDEMGLKESGLNRIIKEGYALLGLISYLTAGKPEVRAWTIKKEPRLLRQRVKYILILKRDLSAQRLSALMI